MLLRGRVGFEEEDTHETYRTYRTYRTTRRSSRRQVTRLGRSPRLPKFAGGSGFIDECKVGASWLWRRRLFAAAASAIVFAMMWIKKKVECQKKRLRMSGERKVKNRHWKNC